MAIEEGGVEVEALTHTGEEEGPTGFEVEFQQDHPIRPDGVGPLKGKAKGVYTHTAAHTGAQEHVHKEQI